MDRETREHVVWVARLRHELRALQGRWSTVPGLAGVVEWRRPGALPPLDDGELGEQLGLELEPERVGRR